VRVKNHALKIFAGELSLGRRATSLALACQDRVGIAQEVAVVLTLLADETVLAADVGTRAADARGWTNGTTRAHAEVQTRLGRYRRLVRRKCRARRDPQRLGFDDHDQQGNPALPIGRVADARGTCGGFCIAAARFAAVWDEPTTTSTSEVRMD